MFLLARQDEIIFGKPLPKATKERIAEWREKASGFRRLASQSECALSSAQWLQAEPLNRLPARDKEWLGALLHALFLHKADLPNKLVVLIGCIDEMDLIVARAVDNKLCGCAGVDLYDACCRLSRAISAIPRTVVIP